MKVSARTYAYKSLARKLNKSLTGFSSFVRSYFDSCLAANLCTQFTDDIGCGVETFEQLVPTLKQIYDYFRKSELRLTPQNCEFALLQTKFLANTITSDVLQPEKEKTQKLLNTTKLPTL